MGASLQKQYGDTEKPSVLWHNESFMHIGRARKSNSRHSRGTLNHLRELYHVKAILVPAEVVR